MSTEIQDQGCHPRYFQRLRRSLSTSTLPARSSPALNLAACLAAGRSVSRGSFLGPAQHLAVPPGRRSFLGVLPKPSASRLLVRCPGVPRSSHPRRRLLTSGFYPRNSDQPALLTRLPSLSVSIRLARRHFRLDSSRACRSPSTLAGFQLRSRGPAVFPPGFCRHTLYEPVFGRFLSIPSR